jgi:hypothetical protein
MPSAFSGLLVISICVGAEKVVTVEYFTYIWPGLLYSGISFASLKAGTNATVTPRRPRLAIPLCGHPIRTPAVIRLPDVEKPWKLHVPSREMFCRKVTIILLQMDINCMKSYTDRGLTPGEGSTRIALLCHKL